MYVVVDVGGEIVIDDVGDVGNIESSSGDGGSDHDGRSTRLERLDGVLSFSLRSVSVNRRRSDVVLLEESFEHVGHSFRLDEDEGESTGREGEEDVEEDGSLVVIFDVFDLLRNVLRSRPYSTDGKEDVVLEEVAGEHLDVAGEGGTEHERLSFRDAGHVLSVDDSSNLGLETHVEHSVGLIEDEVSDVGEGDSSTLDEIDESSRGGRKKIASLVHRSQLG